MSNSTRFFGKNLRRLKVKIEWAKIVLEGRALKFGHRWSPKFHIRSNFKVYRFSITFVSNSTRFFGKN